MSADNEGANPSRPARESAMDEVPPAPPGSLISWLIDWSLRNRFLVACGTLLIIAWGIWAVRHTPVDAIPDLSENQVIVFADWSGRSPQEVEDQVTYPLSTNLQGLAGVKEVRASSMFGFSLLTVVFDDKIDNYFARTRVLERLSFLQTLLPEGVTPQLGPDATGLGWVYQYYLKADPVKSSGIGPDAASGGFDLGTLRSLQDFFLRYQLAAVEGVAEVASIGGFVRQYQVAVDSGKMRQADVNLREVMDALASSNINVGGKVIEENGMEFVVRGIGLVNSLDDLKRIAVRSQKGLPIYLEDIAEISVGGDFRRGALDVDGREVVGGVVVMRTGENAMQVIQRVKEKIAQIAPSLPKGVTIEPFYDRSSLIERTIEIRSHRRRHAAAETEGHDGRDRHRQPPPNHVEHTNRGRSHEASGDASHRRHAQQPPACARCHSRHLLLAKTQDIKSLGRSQFSSQIMAKNPWRGARNGYGSRRCFSAVPWLSSFSPL